MMSKNVCPDGMSWFTPYISVRKVDEIIDFYKKAFHFEVKNALENDDGEIEHALLMYQDQQTLMLGKEGAYDNTEQAPVYSNNRCPLSVYVYCDDVDALYKRALSLGATGDMEPEDMFWGDRMCKLIDPEGYRWGFASIK